MRSGGRESRRYRRYVEQEFDNAVLYRRLADATADEHISVTSQRELLEADAPPSADEVRALTAEGSVAQLEALMRLRGLEAERASDITHRSLLRSGLRQLGIGMLTAVGTFVGCLFDVVVG